MGAQNVEADLRAFVDARLPAMRDTRCVLAASGGADSTAAVALLVEAGAIDPGRCVVGHFDHRLRSAEAAQWDRDAVEVLCAQYKLRLVVESWAAPDPGEAAARDARYTALGRIASMHDAGAIVTGHTADDQVETVVMHAMRGAGLHGLAGMAADAPHPSVAGLRIWRPLLSISRAQTRTYCAARGLVYHDDATNDDRASLRNRVRLDVLPPMERRSPAIRSALLGLAEASRTAADAFDAMAEAVLPEAQGEREIAISRLTLGALPVELLPHVLRLAVARLLGDDRDFERRHFAMLARAVGAATGSIFELPRGLVLTVDAGVVHLSRGQLACAPMRHGLAGDLPYDGVAGAWHVRIVPAGDARLTDGGIDLRLPDGAIVRGRQPGDRVRTRAGGKKLGDWYTDHKIPRREREGAPVIAYGMQVLWTPFGALAELPHGRAWRVMSRRAASPASDNVA